MIHSDSVSLTFADLPIHTPGAFYVPTVRRVASYLTQYNYFRTHGAPTLAKHVAWVAYLNTVDPMARAQWSARYTSACELLEVSTH